MDRSIRPIYAFYGATMFLTLCNSVLALATPWLVLSSTGSVLWTGIIGSVALSAVFTGSLASRWLIKKVGPWQLVLIGFAGNLLGIAGLILCFAQDTLPLGWLLIVVLVDRLFDAAASVAIESRLPEIGRFCGVPLSQLNAIRESLVGAASVLGPAAAGWMLAVINPLYVLAVAAALCVVAIALFVPILVFYRHSAQADGGPSIWQATRWLWGKKQVRSYLILLVVVMACIAGLDDVLLPAFINQTTKNPADIGWILAAYSLAALISAMLYAKHHYRIVDYWLVKTGIVGAALFFIGLVVFDSRPAILAVTFVSGLLSGPLGPIIDTRFLTVTPRHYRISMLAALSVISVGSAPLMVMLHAVVIERFSVAVLCGGVAVGLLLTLFLPLRETAGKTS